MGHGRESSSQRGVKHGRGYSNGTVQQLKVHAEQGGAEEEQAQEPESKALRRRSSGAQRSTTSSRS